MGVSIVKLGSPRRKDEGLRIGTVRRPPRGVPKTQFAKLGYYDVWLPILSPSAKLVAKGLRVDSSKEWKAFESAFRRELAAPDASRTLDLLAALSRQADFSVGCYCENEERCHRSILRNVLKERGAELV